MSGHTFKVGDRVIVEGGGNAPFVFGAGPDFTGLCALTNPQGALVLVEGWRLRPEFERTKRLLGTTDAAVWAAEFMALFGDRRDEIDEDLMLGWFANAIGVGETRVRAQCDAPTIVSLAHALDRPAPGWALIAVERARQVAAEGWTPEHDDEHERGELIAAALAYIDPPIRPCPACNDTEVVEDENWQPDWPGDWRRLGNGFLVCPREHADDFARSSAWPWDAESFRPSPDPVRNLVKAGALIAAEIDRLQRKVLISPAEDQT